MTTIHVNVKKDYLESIIAAKRPVAALVELIWNSLDADADRISIRFGLNSLGALEQIRVQDNGTGIPYEAAADLFGNLGGSWKAGKNKTEKGRNLHGKSGKGRFWAFGLGSLIEWNTTSRRNSHLVEFKVVGSSQNIDAFELSEPAPARGKTTGTDVLIENITSNFKSLTNDDAHLEIAKHFAIYLSEYPGIQIDYNGIIIDPASAQVKSTTYPLVTHILSDGRQVDPILTIIEWKQSQERLLHFCDDKGISLHQVAANIHAPGYNFTAYLKSNYFRDLDKSGLLILDEFNNDVFGLLSSAKSKLKDHFKNRTLEDSAALIKNWKETKIYPYEGEPNDLVEATERKVFDVLAVNINAYLSDFDQASPSNKKFTFNLIKQALNENPASLQRIFSNVLQLPRERQDDLAELLTKTSLSAVISAARIVADRLNFLKGLEQLVFDEKSKQQLLERDQLHKIIENETWIFGEHFHLTNSDDSLDEVLKKHLELLGERSDDKSPVLRDDGKSGRVDLMLSRSVPQPRAEEREHLVVELKRPSKKIDPQGLTQIESYAMAVARDERFRNTTTRWIFWIISNDMTDNAQRRARQKGLPVGLTYEDSELPIKVYAKTWGEIIEECRGRLNFFKKKLWNNL